MMVNCRSELHAHGTFVADGHWRHRFMFEGTLLPLTINRTMLVYTASAEKHQKENMGDLPLEPLLSVQPFQPFLTFRNTQTKSKSGVLSLQIQLHRINYLLGRMCCWLYICVNFTHELLLQPKADLVVAHECSRAVQNASERAAQSSCRWWW